MNRPEHCKSCVWNTRTSGFVPLSTKPCRTLIVTDYPDVAETQEDTGFLSQGRAADMMRRVFDTTGRGEYGVTGVIRCTPNRWSKDRLELDDLEGWQEAVAHCHAYLEQELTACKPRVLVALGEFATSELSGVPAAPHFRGYVHRPAQGPPVVGTYHPHMVGAGNTGLLFALRFDVANALAKSLRQVDTAYFLLSPTESQFTEFIDKLAAAPWGVCDIETPWADEEVLTKKSLSSHILRVSFCGPDLIPATVPWVPPWAGIAEKFFAAPNDKVFWNMAYDVPRLEMNGHHIKGRIVDGMYLWHFLQPDLPKALASVAPYFTDLPEWKSRSDSEPELYSACDAYAEALCYASTRVHLEKWGMLEIAERHVIRLMKILSDMRQRGVQVDSPRLALLKSQFQEDLEKFNKEMRPLVPDEILKVKWYKKIPKEVKDGKKGKTLGGVPGIFIQGEDGRWGLRFEPRYTGAEIKEYLRLRKIKVPRSRKTGNDTTDAKALGRVCARTGDPLLSKILERRKVEKVYSTYTSWPLDERGRVQPTLTLNPATGRLACERPNFQNIPKEGDIATRLRACIVAAPSHVLVAGDFVGMESYLTGYFANDETYMSLATRNIYAWVMARHRNIEPPPLDSPKLGPFLRKVKADFKDDYKKWKSLILGIGYGEGTHTMFYGNPGVFESIGEAEKLRDFLFETFPLIKEWQGKVIELAAKDHKLFNPFRYVRWFFDVPGSESPRALAQLPQSTGAAMIKEDMILLDESWLGEHMVLQIHDELVFDVPEPKVDEAVTLLRSIMERPRPELNGRAIMVEVKTGNNLAEMKVCTPK